MSPHQLTPIPSSLITFADRILCRLPDTHGMSFDMKVSLSCEGFAAGFRRWILVCFGGVNGGGVYEDRICGWWAVRRGLGLQGVGLWARGKPGGWWDGREVHGRKGGWASGKQCC